MAKYGIQTLERRFTINPEAVYGKLFFLGSELQEKFVYVDENGEEHEEQNDQETWKPTRTGEIERKYIMAVSSKLNENMDIRVPLDFDEREIPFRSEIRLTGKVVVVPGTTQKEVQTSNGNLRRVTVRTFPVQAEGVERVVSSKAAGSTPKVEQK